jgi:hypothetical protein
VIPFTNVWSASHPVGILRPAKIRLFPHLIGRMSHPFQKSTERRKNGKGTLPVLVMISSIEKQSSKTKDTETPLRLQICSAHRAARPSQRVRFDDL